MPILADHGDNSPPGSVIYIVETARYKNNNWLGFSFITKCKCKFVLEARSSYLRYPNLQSSSSKTGMICVSDAFDLVRRWNAKECYIVHYSGLLDFEEASNQWFRGPVKAMTTDELQRAINHIFKSQGTMANLE